MKAIQKESEDYGGKDLLKRWVLGLQWKAEGVIDGESECDDCDEVICAEWGEPGLLEESEQWRNDGVAVGDVEADINTRLAKAAVVFRRLDNVWRSSTLSLKIKLDLYTSLIISTAIYASETRKSTAGIRQQLDVFAAEFTEDFGHYVEGPCDEYGDAKPDWAAKITGHCSRETTSDGRYYYQGSGCHLDDQPITPCHGPLVVVADDEVVQRRRGGPHLNRTSWTEESGLSLQTGADGELLLPIVLPRTGGSKC